ncbi:ParM/StbA family protein [Bacillus sp. EB600]|uniref:ParM/StbA family protein n=1 Tax=Bacillus sp. EB600 TaxID=2806345 RepID=UPI00210D255D|nr:ParM/StbA family protein [Bacillus sp. EB600]MCQ6282584.1 ParM/StbA family protein [Bacillus sp. EB600]
MEIKRQNVDFGNSIFQTLVDGYYFEIPTNVVEITKDKADGHFPSSIQEPHLFLQSLLISTTMDGEEKYYLVGDAAEKHVLGNIHINKLHDKTESEIPYVMFLASVAYYNVLKGKGKEDNRVNVNYFSTMLPIWLLKKTNKFSEMQNKMANRFQGDHKVTILTPGLERVVTIHVETSKCRIESEVARWAIKKDFDLQDREEANSFKNFETLIVDLGGGTVDLALLQTGLQAPKSRDSFNCFPDISYLKHIEKLRSEKLLEHFDDVRSLEEFIINNIEKPKMEQKDGNSGKKVDLTEQIHESLREYTQILITKIENTFPSPKDKVYKYVYIGGIAFILQQFIQDWIDKMYGEEIRKENHIFLPDTRKLNIYGLEVLSRHETNVINA